MSKVNEVICTVLQKLAGKSISRLPSKAVHSRLLVEAKHLADVQLGRAMLEEADPSQVMEIPFIEMVQSNIIDITKILKLPLHLAKHIQWAFLSWGSQTYRQSWMPLSMEWKKFRRY